MNRSTVVRLLFAGALATSLGACERQERSAEEKGPAERAGEQIDHALNRAGDELNKVAEKTGKNLQEVGRRLQREAQEARAAREEREAQQAQRDGSGERSSGQ